jgi:hypothetical protein
VPLVASFPIVTSLYWSSSKVDAFQKAALNVPVDETEHSLLTMARSAPLAGGAVQLLPSDPSARLKLS